MKMNTSIKALVMGTALVVLTAACASKPISHEGTKGTVKAVDLVAAWVGAGAPNANFHYTDMDGKPAIGNFKNSILPLFTTDGIWGDGTQACTACHFDNSEDSYHEMDLSSYEGMMKGADVNEQPPGVPLFGQSMGTGMKDFDWGHSKMKERLRNNRMPPGIEFDITEENRDGPCVSVGANSATVMHGKFGCDLTALGAMAAWVNAGAPKTGQVHYPEGQRTKHITFAGDILPMFTKDEYWGEGTQSCVTCHFDNSEDSYHEMDLSSYEGMMKGADVNEQPPGVPLFGQSMGMGMTDYNWGKSKMKARMRNNRMPPGIEFDITEENRDGPVVGH